MASKKYTLEQLQAAVKTSFSIGQVLKKLGLKPAGGSYQYFHNMMKKYNIDTSHFKGKSHGSTIPTNRRPIEVYLSNQFTIGSSLLRKRLINEGLLINRCSFCGLTEWNGKKITLELDHIDGNHFNNNLSNLRLLCPNCHSIRHSKV